MVQTYIINTMFSLLNRYRYLTMNCDKCHCAVEAIDWINVTFTISFCRQNHRVTSTANVYIDINGVKAILLKINNYLIPYTEQQFKGVLKTIVLPRHYFSNIWRFHIKNILPNDKCTKTLVYVLMPNMQIIISVPFYMYQIFSLLPRDRLQKGCKAILRIHQGNLLHSVQANSLRVHWGNARETSLWCTNLIYMHFFNTPSSQQFGLKLAAQEYGNL